jgi:hypothetical protein
MFLRCPSCHSAVWLATERATGEGFGASCSRCDAEFHVAAEGDLAAAQEELSRTAVRLGRENAIDLPSAYSILLGILTLEQVLDVGRADSLVVGLAPGARGDSAGCGYDPAFTEAVAAGTLSPRQALERGDRQALIERLVERHGLSEELAIAVTDNRTALLVAIRAHRERTRARPSRARRRARRRRLSAAASVVVLLGVGSHGRLLWNREVLRVQEVQARSLEASARASAAAAVRGAPVAQATRLAPGAEWTADSTSRLLEVRAPSAQAVLAAFCTASPESGFLEPFAVAGAEPPHPGLRFGVFQDRRESSGLQAIRIRKDPRTSRWIAGDGREPIPRLGIERLALDPAFVVAGGASGEPRMR